MGCVILCRNDHIAVTLQCDWKQYREWCGWLTVSKPIFHQVWHRTTGFNFFFHSPNTAMWPFCIILVLFPVPPLSCSRSVWISRNSWRILSRIQQHYRFTYFQSVPLADTISPQWAAKMLQTAQSMGCKCRPLLLKLAGRLLPKLTPSDLHEMPPSLLCEMVQQVCTKKITLLTKQLATYLAGWNIQNDLKDLSILFIY